jgi:hypothetical protein
VADSWIQPSTAPVRFAGRRQRRWHVWVATASIVVAGAAMVAGCSIQGQAGATGSEVASWLSSSAGGAAIGQTAADSRNIEFTLSHHDSASAVRAACALLTNDALTAIGNLPTPDEALTDALNSAYQDASAAGDDCYKGASGNKALLRRSASERAKFSSLMAVAVDRYEVIAGHPPSTSTTQASDGCDDPFASCSGGGS